MKTKLLVDADLLLRTSKPTSSLDSVAILLKPPWCLAIQRKLFRIPVRILPEQG